MPFLPVTPEEMHNLGWDTPDIIAVTGDAYVDHPSFGLSIITRVLEEAGHNVCVLPQPQNARDFSRFGRPKLGFFVTSGNIDSMVAHYTAAKRIRRDDAYTAGGKAGARPDRAVNVYCHQIREMYPDIPIIIGGLEASLRRFAHYDYWDDSVHPSILIDSGADLLVYGMGEKQTVEIARRLAAGETAAHINDIRGTVLAVPVREYLPRPCAECPSLELVTKDLKQHAIACRIQQDEQDAVRGKTVIQRHNDKIVVQNPPMSPLTGNELDRVYELPYMRDYHPMYIPLGGVPGIEEVKFSITHNRGCFGACNFCSLAYHQGRQIACRSEDSVVREAEIITKMPDFKGYIHDVGGPTANFRTPSCKKQLTQGLCKGKKCLAPEICPSINVDHGDYLHLLRRLRKLPNIKKVFIRSGIRFDYLLADKNETFFKELVEHHVSGQLKVAPEHCSTTVLDYMGKPSIATYRTFQKRFYELTKSMGKKQYLVPYLMSSHPGSTINQAIELAVFLKKEGLRPEQVQDFYPTPGTISTCMFYTGLDPYTLKPVYVPRTQAEKAKQRALLQYYRPQNRNIVLAALKSAGRTDLIGNPPECLVDDPDENKQVRDSRQNAKTRQGRGVQTLDRGRIKKKNKLTNKKGRNAHKKG
ncbi:MAG: YgiQ family radical SAM protein [Oscillospiraceae bacterium]|nr:YgiQ family radical SAM protein [Oscillospiraceae bacterium]